MHLFNIAGYNLVFDYFIQRSDREMAKQLDENEFCKECLIEVKTPLHMPYMLSSEYTRIDGSIEIDGIQFNYVKRKIENDTLYLLCLPNMDKTRLHRYKSKFAAQAADNPVNGQEQGATQKKHQQVSDYNQSLVAYYFELPSEAAVLKGDALGACLLHPYVDIPYHPPEPAFV